MKNVMGLITTNYTVENMGKLSEQRPVATIPFGGRYRIVDFPLSNMVHSGIRSVGMTSSHYYRSLIDHLGSGKEWSLNRKEDGLYLLPGSVYGMERFKGKFLLRDLINNRPYVERSNEEYVIISAGNKIFNIDYELPVNAHIESGADVTVIYKEIANANMKVGTFLEMDHDGNVTRFMDEATGISAWFMDTFIINRSRLLDFMSWYENMDYIDMMEILKENIGRIKINSWNFTGYVGSIDSVYDYMQCSLDLLKEPIHDELFYSTKPIFTKTQDGPPTKYLEGCKVSNSLVSSGSIIEGTVENSVLFRNVKVGKGAVIKNSVIMQRCTIAPGAVLENVICDKFVQINEGVKLSGNKYTPLVIGKNQKL